MQKESNWTVLLLTYVLYYIFVCNTNYIKLKKDNFLHTNISPTFLLLDQWTNCNFSRFDRKYLVFEEVIFCTNCETSNKKGSVYASTKISSILKVQYLTDK